MSTSWKTKKGPPAAGSQSCIVRLLDGTDVVLDASTVSQCVFTISQSNKTTQCE